jgi:guanylate kinase
MNERFIVLMGPSGCGKSTLEAYCRELNIPVNISNTTRTPRKGEIDGFHYYFNTVEKFFQVDLAEKNKYGLNYYGISKVEIKRNFAINNVIVAVAEIEGVKQLKEAYPDELEVVFITIPLDEMEKRMRARGDSEENIQTRLLRAIEKKEHEHGWIADYTIVNWDLDQSKAQLRGILGVTSSE